VTPNPNSLTHYTASTRKTATTSIDPQRLSQQAVRNLKRAHNALVKYHSIIHGSGSGLSKSISNNNNRLRPLLALK
jgi:hypothetical protein